MGRHRRRSNRSTAGRIAVGGLVLAGAATGFVKVSAEAAPPPALKKQVETVAWVAPQDRPALPSADYVPDAPDYSDLSTDQTSDQMSTNPADLFDHYIVQPGDTLTHIAAAYGIPWQSLWAANSDQLAHPDLLFVGEVLRLPF